MIYSIFYTPIYTERIFTSVWGFSHVNLFYTPQINCRVLVLYSWTKPSLKFCNYTFTANGTQQSNAESATFAYRRHPMVALAGHAGDDRPSHDSDNCAGWPLHHGAA